jgi:hypothetical protein
MDLASSRPLNNSSGTLVNRLRPRSLKAIRKCSNIQIVHAYIFLNVESPLSSSAGKLVNLLLLKELSCQIEQFNRGKWRLKFYRVVNEESPRKISLGMLVSRH